MASTYVNDLRLNEMATGDQSGSWGTVTNTNLELIAEAFSYSTEAITTNADTHTTTIADGATDPGRSMFLKYTGTLDSACTITIGPNTVSKLWFIENATSGSQNIIIKQGSGATVTIASGKTKVIYSDGVGSGAKMVDAFAALDVGSVSVDNITIDGNEIDVSSGDLTLDVAGNIKLDADSGLVYLSDGGTDIGLFSVNNQDLNIRNTIADKDIYFQGNDGGSNFTALTLDMSASGRATFNNNVVVTDNNSLVAGSGDDLQITYDGSNGEIDVSSGDLTLDVAGNIVLDADGGGVYFKDAGTTIGFLQNSGADDFRLVAGQQDKDIVFMGNDGGSIITALTLDMSAAGKSTFFANMDIRADDARLLIEEADGTDIVWLGDVTGGGVGGSYLYNHGGTATVQMRADQYSTISKGILIDDSSAGVEALKIQTPRNDAISTGLAYINVTDSVAPFSALTIDHNGTGKLIEFRKGGSTVGGIGVVSGKIYIGTGDTTLSFPATADLIAPTGTAGATRDGAISLGNSSNRFKDVYAVNYYGDGSNLTGISAGRTYGSTATTTSGTSFTFTGIPAGVYEVNLLLNGVNVNGGYGFFLRLGTSSGIVSSGYQNQGAQTFAGGSQSALPNVASDFDTGFSGLCEQQNLFGYMKLTRTESNSNTWIYNAHYTGRYTSGTNYSSNNTFLAGGLITLGGELTQIQIIRERDGKTFTNGSATITWSQ